MIEGGDLRPEHSFQTVEDIHMKPHHVRYLKQGRAVLEDPMRVGPVGARGNLGALGAKLGPTLPWEFAQLHCYVKQQLGNR